MTRFILLSLIVFCSSLNAQVTKADYYNKALMKISDEFIKTNDSLGNYTFIVFSDDTQACKKDFDGSNFLVIDNKEEYANIIDLIMYSMCGHYIIANSSYSWWGSWLGNRNWDKIVIAPELWFGIGYQFGGKNIPSKRFIKV